MARTLYDLSAAELQDVIRQLAEIRVAVDDAGDALKQRQLPAAERALARMTELVRNYEQFQEATPR